MIADFRQRIPRVNTALLFQRQVPKTQHSAQLPILRHRQPSDLSAAHEAGGQSQIHIRRRGDNPRGHDRLHLGGGR